MVTNAQDAGRQLLELFERIYIINLPARTDRKDESAQQLARLGLSFDHPQVTLFPAARPEDKGDFETVGTKGCFLSHLGVLTEALASGAETFLILEDDADFTRDFEDRIAGLVAASGQKAWHLWYGWYPASDTGAAPPPTGTLEPVPSDQKIHCSHFIGFRRAAAEAALPYLQGIADRPGGHPEGGAMHVDGAYNWFRAAHPDLVTIAPTPPVTFQRPSRTDIHPLKWFDRLPLTAPIVTKLRQLRHGAR